MPDAPLTSSTGTERAVSSAASSPRGRLEGLATEMARALEPSGQAAGGNPVQVRLGKLESFFRSAYLYFEGASMDQSAFSAASEWVLDNFYVLEQAIRQVREGMPPDYYRRLPHVALDGRQEAVARIYALSAAITAASQSSLDANLLVSFVQAYQAVDGLRIGEIWALPIMLRLSILETLATALANLTHIPFSALPPLPIPGVEGSNEPPPSDETLVINAIMSLRLLATQDWKAFFERLSLVEQALDKDPLGMYARMDFDTRNRYRNVVEKLAYGCESTEVQVAELATRLAGEGSTKRERHVGYYLLDGGQAALEARLGYRKPPADRLRDRLYAHAFPFYLGAISLLTLVMTFGAAIASRLVGGNLPEVIFAALFAILPASAVAVDLVNWLVMRLIPPRTLPKLDFQKGIPPEYATVVVIPAMLTSQDELRSLLRQIESHYLATRTPICALLY